MAQWLMSTIANITLCSIITTVSGSCIPAWILANVAINVTIDGFNLSNYAISNSHVGVIGLLYKQERDDLQLLLARSTTASRDIRLDLMFYETLLSSQSDVDCFKARFLGFQISFEVLRTLAVTLFTLGIGLYSTLRGLSVFVNPQTFCEIR